MLDFPVDEPLILHLFPRLVLVDFELISELHFFDHLLDILDERVLLDQLFDHVLDSLFICNRLVSLVDHFSKSISFLADSPNEPTHVSFRPEVLFGDFFLRPLQD